MRRLLPALVLLFSLSVSAQQVAKNLKASNGETIGFYEYKPADYKQGGEGYPVIIFLHGIGERGNGSSDLSRVLKTGLPKFIERGEKMTFRVNGKTETFLVLSPQLSSKYGSWQNFYVDEMIKYAESKLNIDPSRIYLTGLSLGGGGVWNFASASLENAKKLAAIAPICGTCQMKNAGNIAKADLPIWAFHAKNDNVVRISCTQNAISNIKNAGPGVDPIVTIWSNGGHNIWDRVYNKNSGYNDPTIFEWFLTQSRNSAPVANKKPVAKAPSELTVSTKLGKIELDASQSYDPDGEIVSFSWRKVSGPSGILGNLLSRVSLVTGLTKTGKHEFELKVVDNRGASDVARVTINVIKEDDDDDDDDDDDEDSNKPPTADAGSNLSITLPTNSVDLDGSNSKDEDGKIESYRWTQESGPSEAEIESKNKARTKVSKLKKGRYVFRLRVTDNDDDSDDAEVTVVVEEKKNRAPISNAGSDFTVELPNKGRLDGSKSSDPDGDIKSWEWTKVSGPTVKIAKPSSAITEISNLKVGTYVFRLTVTDNDKAKHSSEIKVTVTKKEVANKPPVANAGEAFTVQLPGNGQLNGQQSVDEDGSIKSWSWTKVSGPGVRISDPNKAITAITDLNEGVYTFRLTITDDKNAKSTAEVKVTVRKPQPAVNKAPVANAGPDAEIMAPGSAVTLDGRDSYDEDGKITSYQWQKVSGPNAQIRTPKQAVSKVTHLEPGVYVFRLTVTDNHKATATSEKRVSVIRNGNASPIARIAGKAQIQLPENEVELDGSKSSDPDGSIVSYSWTKVSGSSATIRSAKSAKTTITGLKAGDYVFRLTVTDNKKASSSTELRLKVLSNSNSQQGGTLNRPPVANAGPDRTTYLPNTQILIDAVDCYDPDGRIVKYQWSKVSGPAAQIYTPNDKRTSFRSLRQGTYIFRLTVTDDKGATAHDDVTVRVLPKGSEMNQSNDLSGTDVAADVSASPEIHEIRENKLELFPNPATSNINLKISSTVLGAAHINIYDASGKLIKRIAFQKTQALQVQLVNVADLHKGMYHLEVVVDRQTRMTSKFIKN